MRKIFSLLAAVLFAGSMMASEAIMQYTGGVTTNMVGDGANNAATVGLDADLFTVLADKGSNQNLPGLNKANDIRLYADKNSGNGNIITVSIASGTITSIVLDIKQTATFVVKAGETAVTEENGAYAINAASFSIQNTTTGATTQLQLNKITITYTAEGGTTPDPEPEPEPVVAADVDTVYDWAYAIGSTILGGNSNISISTVKIHTNTDDVNCLKFGSSFVYADGKWVAIKPAEGAFKAGDTLKVAAVFNNSDDTKYAQVDLRAADGDTRIWLSDSASTINSRTSADDPIVQNYVLEADADSLFLGRYGNTGMCVTFLQVVRAKSGDEPVVEKKTCADVYSLADNDEVALNDVTVTYVSGKNVWVKDATASMLLYLSADATWAAGDVLAGVAGVKATYKGLVELKPTADQVAAVVATASEAPAPEELTVVADADMNKYILLKGVTAEGAFVEGTASNLDITLGENTYVLRNFMKNAYTFEAGKTYNVTALVSIFNTLQLYFISAEEVAAPVVFSHELYGSEALPVVDKTWFANTSWAEETNSSAAIVNDYDIQISLVDAKAGQWQSQIFVNPGFTWEVGAYYKMELDLTTNNQLGGVTFKVNDKGEGFFYSYPNDNLFLADQTTHFVADSIYIAEEPTNGGQLIFSIGWCDANTNILISNIVITKYEAPAETITINITEGTEWLDATADEGWWQIMGENEGYAVSLSNVGGAAEAAGTYTIDQMDPAYTYVKPVNGTEKITFTEGSVVVAVDAETEIVTVTATLLGTDGNTYDISMVYDPSKVDPYKYDEEVDDFEYTFESYIVNDKYVATNGILIVNAQSETTAVTMYLIPEEGQTALTAGEYAVAAVPAYGTVLAGSYDQGVSPSYAATLVAEAGQLYLDQVWYFVSGKVTVDANLNIVVDALNSKGKAIKATLKGETQGIEDVDAAAKAIKTVKNGQLIIEKNGVQYNAQGAVIR